MNTPLEVVTEVESLLYAEDFVSEGHFSVVLSGGDVVVVDEHEYDTYDLIDSPLTPLTLDAYGYLCIVTHGWACPIKPDGEQVPPSMALDRRRVRLVTLVTMEKIMASAVRFLDNGDLETDTGDATGALADALVAVVDKVSAQ
jgi:hypothetical protein